MFKVKKIEIIKNPQYYIPGFMEIQKAPTKVKWALITHFCIRYLADTVLIYATMWSIYSAQSMGAKSSKAYCIGMRDGSMALAAYTLFSSSIIVEQLNKQIVSDVNIIQVILGITGIFTFLAFIDSSQIWPYTCNLMIGACVGVYN